MSNAEYELMCTLTCKCTCVMESCLQVSAGPEQAPLPCAGEELEVKANLATPAHQYVPWILVDGIPLGKASESSVFGLGHLGSVWRSLFRPAASCR